MKYAVIQNHKHTILIIENPYSSNGYVSNTIELNTAKILTMQQFLNKKGQVIGSLYDDGIFRKKVSREIHLYKRDNAWGMDEDVLKELPAKTEIRILDMDTNIVYSTTKEVFASGSRIDYGHSPQITLWLGFFDVIKDKVRENSKYVEAWMNDYKMFRNYPQKTPFIHTKRH